MNSIKYISAFFIVILMIFSCRDVSVVEDIIEDEVPIVIDSLTYSDWSTDTHSSDVLPDYTTVFPQDTVLRLDLKISSANWSDMQQDLYDYLRYSSSDNPMWVEASVYFNNIEWYHVGVRYKGNSSLQSAYQSGNGKLSFKLDFDEFENDYTDITNQRFFGFKQLNLNNNYDDSSLLREKVSSDLFRDFGLPAANTTFCAVYVDNGSGPQYFGLYTIVEEVDDTVLDDQFEDGSGNLYKPDGDAASFAQGTFDTSEMEIKTNEDGADFADVRSLYDAINSSTRTSDSELWMSELEALFNVDHFLKWLAANTTIQNWDTYGNMTHNYYIYNNPTDSLLTWIPWDNNEALQDGKQSGALSFGFSEVGSSWPLIKYIMDQPVYEEQYEAYLREFVDEVFTTDRMVTLYSGYYDLLKSYAYAEEKGYTFLNSSSSFDSAISTLKTHVAQRNSAVDSYLD